MADINLTNLANLQYELRVPLQTNYRKKYPLTAELKRVLSNEPFAGSGARIPVILNSLQGGGNPGESGTINVPQNFSTTAATVHLQNVVQPFSLTLDAEEDTMDNAAAQAFSLASEEAFNSIAEIENDQICNQSALLATADTTQATAGGLTMKVQAQAAGTAGTNFDGLYPGRVVDVLTRSTGADPGQGLRRKIASVSESASPPTVTFDTNQTASDGGSGNISLSNLTGIYIAGVYTSTANNALQSVSDVASTTSTNFENINKTSVTGWQGVDGRNADTSIKMLSIQMLDGAVRRGRRNGGFAWKFAMGFPASIDGYKQGLYAQVRYSPQVATLDTGFGGIVYDGADRPIPLIKEDRYRVGTVDLVPTDDLMFLVGKKNTAGPDWVDDDGAKGRRFNRSLPKEFWVRDKIQFTAKRCNRWVRLADLDVAA